MVAGIRYAEIAAAQECHSARLMALPNVVGTGIGYRLRDGQPTNELCLVVLVSRKLAPAALADEALLPRALDGVPLNVVETGALAN